ncbi:MAG: Hsp20/alpha crystallin family protein [Magnetococcales bacterium]|nr:Hsp20/alpha crystallin family protein [Magnetococcales bacterium]MBF0149263.1 Hsp20/alpha crystallin family protein [Magnetococcales bacterium]MBF0172796.1 Hsp20/alpha crystallin family protein [Magnetococcales bacterium]MBF0348006.1 Hsp20/alpha crystallin family protein [Magnetococcales bacterium]MBF0632171.1 Hsp20/alpha crystallin family protein [Magnetococcales bacterium]
MSTIVTYDPFRNFRALQNEINRLFDRDLEDSTGQMTQWPLRVDIREDEHQIVLKADIPGMEQKDIKVNVDNGRLTISGERKFDDEEHKENYQRVERPFGRFSRTFQLTNTTDLAKIGASYKNGVLEVTLPKLEEAKPRSIQVQIH